MIDAVGCGATRAAACRLVRPGGVISHAGLQDDEPGLDTRKLTLQEVTFIGNYTYTVSDLLATVEAIEKGRFGDLAWLDRRPLSDGASAFSDVHNGTTSSPKIVLYPDA